METLLRDKVDTSLDGKGWSVRLGTSSWRFGRESFAKLFIAKMKDEVFASDILEHAHGHVWEECDPKFCVGLRWQMIQGLE